MKTHPNRLSIWLRWGLLALVQLGLIALPLAERLEVQASGARVALEVVPVDPRDLLRGDYVIINLAISRLAADLPGFEAVEDAETVFVELAAGGDRAALPVAVSRERASLGPLAIAGRVIYRDDSELRVDYGIDAFFLPEGEGREIERLDTSRLLLQVAVSDDGRSLPVGLLVDGKLIRSDALF